MVTFPWQLCEQICRATPHLKLGDRKHPQAERPQGGYDFLDRALRQTEV